MPDQYLFVNDTLVAPIMSAQSVPDSRRVWIPPGEWQDAWNGSVVAGPAWHVAHQPVQRIPMWHRRGGLVVTVPAPKMRVELQDWSTLVLEAFPAHPCLTNAFRDGLQIYSVGVTRRVLYEKNATAASPQARYLSALRSEILFRPQESDGIRSWVELHITSSRLSYDRSYVLRLHLCPGQMVTAAKIDGVDVSDSVKHLAPPTSSIAELQLAELHNSDYLENFPFREIGQLPALYAGNIAVIQVPVVHAGDSLHITAELTNQREIQRQM